MILAHSNMILVLLFPKKYYVDIVMIASPLVIVLHDFQAHMCSKTLTLLVIGKQWQKKVFFFIRKQVTKIVFLKFLSSCGNYRYACQGATPRCISFRWHSGPGNQGNTELWDARSQNILHHRWFPGWTSHQWRQGNSCIICILIAHEFNCKKSFRCFIIEQIYSVTIIICL